MKRMTAALVTASALCLLLAGALVASLMGARSLFEDRSELRLRPVDPVRFAAQNRALPIPGERRLVMFGDSRAQLMAKASDAPPAWEVVNRGVSGESSVQSAYRFQHDVIELKPTAVVIVTGINDLIAAANLPRREKESVANLKSNITRFAKEASAHGAVTVVSTIVRPAMPRLIRLPFWSDRVYALVDEVNAHIRGLASSNILILDADRLLAGGAARLPSRFAVDEIHLSESAHQLLNVRLMRLLGRSSSRDQRSTNAFSIT